MNMFDKMNAFVDDLDAVALIEKKHGVTMTELYEAIKEGRIDNNKFQVILVDFLNLCREFSAQRETDSLATLIYLWTRDADMAVGEETERYIKGHLACLRKTNNQYSDKARIEMARRLATKR